MFISHDQIHRSDAVGRKREPRRPRLGANPRSRTIVTHRFQTPVVRELPKQVAAGSDDRTW